MTDIRPFLTAEWRYLVMINYRVDPQVVAAHAPTGTEVDLFQGDTYISMVGFLFVDTRLVGVPAIGHAQFERLTCASTVVAGPMAGGAAPSFCASSCPAAPSYGPPTGSRASPTPCALWATTSPSPAAPDADQGLEAGVQTLYGAPWADYLRAKPASAFVAVGSPVTVGWGRRLQTMPDSAG